MLKRWMKNQKGFTLVELLAVIVILGIIAAIAIPAIGHIINKTDDKAKVSEAVQIIDAAKLYVASEGIDSNTELGNDKLGDYLDNVDDTNYTVHVTFDGGHASYSISGHDAVGIVNKGDPVSEKDLLEYLGKKSSNQTSN
ncbi:prepilin-type N-terminal cleavage/methylation domain-containing protein [Tuberibacillus calidus]|jgi:type IV pilus assembly protein PilA|uniref:prepilin-type N-terminal cleavage/methylation domain-containing protein n=1 Tax=Tuberibacillus calidus TaxID=340097 RepID=UPI00041A9177|nr:prepilin-type N-terminal cleavage/methylation domain-containing protein [Tuberibacillus calidus]